MILDATADANLIVESLMRRSSSDQD